MTLHTTFSSVPLLQSNESLSRKALARLETAEASTASQPTAPGGLCQPKVLLENFLALPICHLNQEGNQERNKFRFFRKH